ncbi:MAG: tetratricopeptide repeat protein, partial [candidate division NC10 bacterium]
RRELRRRLAESLSYQGRFERALTEFRGLLAVPPEDRATRLGYARTLHWAGRSAEAVPEYERLVQTEPSDSEILRELGQARLAAGMPYTALMAYEAALAMNSTDRPARLGLAQALAAAGEYGEAIRAYDAILREDLDDVSAWYGRAETLTWAQRYEEAEAWLQTGLRRFPQERRLQLDLPSLLLAERRFGDAIAALRRVTAPDVDPGRAAGVEAEALRYLGRSDEARGAIERARAATPNDPFLWTALGELSLREGRSEQATIEFRNALQIRPDLIEARYGLWKAEHGSGDAGAAKPWSQWAAGPEGPRRLARLAELLAADGQFGESAAVATTALQANPHLTAASFTLAEARAAQENYGAATGLYREMLEGHPRNDKSGLGLARALSWSDQFGPAVVEYDRLLVRDPTDPVARRERARVLGWAQDFDAARDGYAALFRDPPSGPDGPLPRFEEQVRLERTSKEALWLGRQASGLEALDRLLAVEPGNLEARFDQGQAFANLGLWRSAERAYQDLLRQSPLHRQAAVALERFQIEQGPRGQMGYEFFQSRGRGTLANLVRHRGWAAADLPLAAEGFRFRGEYAHTYFPKADTNQDSFRLRLDGRLTPQLIGWLGGGYHDYRGSIGPTWTGEAGMAYRLWDRVTLALDYGREDVVE